MTKSPNEKVTNSVDQSKENDQANLKDHREDAFILVTRKRWQVYLHSTDFDLDPGEWIPFFCGNRDYDKNHKRLSTSKHLST